VADGSHAQRLAGIVTDAALALAVSDLVDDAVIERLSGAWRRVVH
jgi:hypothetical protein